MQMTRFGPDALIVSGMSMRPSDLASALGRYGDPNIVDIVVGASSVTIRCSSRQEVVAVRALVDSLIESLAADRTRTLTATGDDLPGSRTMIEIPVVFDGPDLIEIAAACELGVSEVVELVTTAKLEAAFVGFSAGFAYLTGLPEVLYRPRRPTPRSRVKAGSVAIAGGYAGVYTVDSPGGWNIIGHTALELWDIDREPPALIVPGTVVTMRAVHP